MNRDIFIIEIKARANSHEKARLVLQQHEARFSGVDHQIDTYFIARNGRLKLREGNIECSLIAYERVETDRLKESSVVLYKPADPSTLKRALASSIGVRGTVDKMREIFFVGNIKFHLDDVKGVGRFIEIEAISEGGVPGREVLEKQVDDFMKLMEITDSDLVRESYVDLAGL